MLNKIIPYCIIAAAGLVFLLACASLVAMLRALTVSTTLAAIETAFGTFVLAIILLVSARRLYDAGLKRLKTAA